MDLILAPEMERLRSGIRDMAGLVSQAIERCACAETTSLPRLRHAIRDRRYLLQHDCTRAIAEQRPVAEGLTELAELLRSAGDLERIVDALSTTPSIRVAMSDYAPLHNEYRNLALRVGGIVQICTEACLSGDRPMGRSAQTLIAAARTTNRHLRDKIKLRMSWEDNSIDEGLRLLGAASQLERAIEVLALISNRISESDQDGDDDPLAAAG